MRYVIIPVISFALLGVAAGCSYEHHEHDHRHRGGGDRRGAYRHVERHHDYHGHDRHPGHHHGRHPRHHGRPYRVEHY